MSYGKSILNLYYNYDRKENVILYVLSIPVLTLQPGILGILLGLMGRIAKKCAREVRLSQVSCILMYVCVAAPRVHG